MEPSVSLEEVPGVKSATGTVMTYRPLLDADGWQEALRADISTVAFADAYRSLGLTDVTFWLQRNPDAAMARWEGADVDTLLDRYAVSRDPVLSRWRGRLRTLSGPVVAESFWNASHHRFFSWASGEEGAQSEITVYRKPREVEAFQRLSLDFQQDPSLMKLFERVRRHQGFTRIETWHQHTDGGDAVLTLFEAHDLGAAMAQRAAEANRLDERIMQVERKTLFHQERLPPVAKLFARWHA